MSQDIHALFTEFYESKSPGVVFRVLIIVPHSVCSNEPPPRICYTGIYSICQVPSLERLVYEYECRKTGTRVEPSLKRWCASQSQALYHLIRSRTLSAEVIALACLRDRPCGFRFRKTELAVVGLR